MKHLLRLENGLIFVGLTAVYFILGHDWRLFAILFLAPDLSFLAYLAGPKMGAWAYNFLHFAGLAVALAVLGLVTDTVLLIQIGLILGAHIAFDRMLGYGLKHETGFADTHLGKIGRPG